MRGLVERQRQWVEEHRDVVLTLMCFAAVLFSAWGVYTARSQSYTDARQAQRVAMLAQQTAAEKAAQAVAAAQAESVAIQRSRFSGALLSCEQLNDRHLNAQPVVGEVAKLSPTAGIATQQLIDVLAPLRDGKDGRETCQQYAASETAITVPVPGS